MAEGWIGKWSPGIGDPTIGGWLTVLLYFGAAWSSWRVVHLERRRLLLLSDHEKTIWWLMLIGLLVLGFNKQLDLQSALTEIGRMVAREQGWYGNRRQIQEAFVAAVPVAGLTVLAVGVFFVRRQPAATLWACVGVAGLLVFIAIRAVSFHQVDEILGVQLAGIPLNWLLEMGPLMLIGWNAVRRVRVQQCV